MAFTCKDCLQPGSSAYDWELSKFAGGMGISRGRCECCGRPQDCVNTPNSHRGECEFRAPPKPTFEEQVAAAAKAAESWLPGNLACDRCGTEHGKLPNVEKRYVEGQQDAPYLGGLHPGLGVETSEQRTGRILQRAKELGWMQISKHPTTTEVQISEVAWVCPVCSDHYQLTLASWLSMDREHTGPNYLAAARDAANRLVQYNEPNVDFFDDFPFAIDLLEEGSERTDMREMLAGLGKWERCETCGGDGVLDRHGPNSRRCGDCYGKGLVSRDPLS